MLASFLSTTPCSKRARLLASPQMWRALLEPCAFGHAVPAARSALNPLFLLAKYYLSSGTHLWESCHELPQFKEMSFLNAKLFVLKFHQKQFLLIAGRFASWSVFTTLTLLT